MNDLAKKWIEAKRQEDIAKKIRTEVEKEILASGVNLKPEGTNHYADALVITTGYTRKWDQDGLFKLDGDMPPGLFKTEYKEVRNNTKALEEMSGDYWRSTFGPLLTLVEKKPSFKEKS